MLVTYPEERYFYCCISSIFLIYSLLEHMGSLCACGPFHADPTFLHDFLRGWNGCGGVPTVQKIRHWVLQPSSQACIVAADS